MKVSANWLQTYLEQGQGSPAAMAPEALSDLLTQTGLEVEDIEYHHALDPERLKGLVIGEVLEAVQHPNADRLRITKVSIGGYDGQTEPLQIVCGAPNVAAGQKVVVATIGTKLTFSDGTDITIKKGKIRGEESWGMICAEDEIGLSGDHAGIMVLDDSDDKVTVGQPFADYYSANMAVEADAILTIGLTPNRGDAACHTGVARDIAAVTRTRVQYPQAPPLDIQAEGCDYPVTIHSVEACPRYSGLIVNGVKIGPSPAWLKSRLESVGATSINNVVDVTNFIMLEMGQPLHAFDADKIAGDRVVVRQAHAGETITLLDKSVRELNEDDLVIANGEVPMALAGIMGGLHYSVADATTRVFLESANFTPQGIRKSLKRHGLRSDAAFRYERGVSVDLTIPALERAAQLLLENGIAESVSLIQDVFPKPTPAAEINLLYFSLDRIAGAKLPRHEVKEILDHLDIEITYEHGEGLTLIIPTYRTDVTREIDVIEEILRIYGYNNLKGEPTLTYPAINARGIALEDWQDTLSNHLIALGFTEMLNVSLSKPGYAKLMDVEESRLVRLANPLSDDLSVMRYSMLFNGLETIVRNANRKESDLRFFEFGRTYRRAETEENGVEERTHLSLFTTGFVEMESWATQPRPKHSFQEINATVHILLQRLGIKGFVATPMQDGVLHYGLSFVTSGGDYLGKAGRVRPSILRALGLKEDVFFAVFDWEFLGKQASGQKKGVKEPSKFPSVRRDLSLLMPMDMEWKSLSAAARSAGGSLLTNVEVFDVYRGERLGEGQKSYAIALTLADPSRTLTDEDVDATVNAVAASLEQVGATVRRG